MDPSYNQAPQQVPQQPQVSPQMPQRPQVPQRPQMPISSGAGDVVVNNGSEKKSRKGVIVLIILLVVLAVVGIVAAVMMNPQNGAGQVGSNTDLKESYNRFVNYVVFGKESNEDVVLSEVEGATWYYSEVEDDKKAEYLEEAEMLYNDLKNSYEGYSNGAGENEEVEKETMTVYEEDENGEIIESTEEVEQSNTIDIEVLKTLFIDSEKVEQLGNEEILSLYVANGEEAVRNTINQRYNMDEAINEDMKDFLTVERKFAEAYLAIIVAENNAGCIVEGVEIEGCYTASEEENAALTDSAGDLFSILLSFNTRSLNTIEGIHEIVYGMQEEVETEETEEAETEEVVDE